ncbi:hypothetical protein SAMN07250955_11572 [Arboricoccus pini]|uniref:GDSL-like Lipase/Acylhydrolase family protein n=1 Tax=Arboricoccus pini TaxID=1963835 RepID=A0A212RW13_9PROT|nr:hypothetical protein [Arboricoccus pini]SNB76783.1 hypothetical protein SAMN07250955_11572 [Arboricoccus pini]
MALAPIFWSKAARRLEEPDFVARLGQRMRPDPENAPPFAPGISFAGILMDAPFALPRSKTSQPFAGTALTFANWTKRQERDRRYTAMLADAQFARTPILLVEGDSWAQFPVELTDMIAYSSQSFIVKSLAAAGDTFQNMVDEAEYTRAWQGPDLPSALFLSAGGNDIIGADLNGRSALHDLVAPSASGAYDPALINQAALTAKLDMIERLTATMAGHIDRPLFIHGYANVHPGGNEGEWRHPTWTSVDKWLGSVLRELGYKGQPAQDAVIRHLIGALNDRLAGLAGRYPGKIVHVDLRDVRLVQHEDWYDEIHPNSQGFAKLGQKIFEVLVAAGVSQRR